LVTRGVRSPLDENHDSHAECVSGNPERLGVAPCEREHRWVELKVVSVQLDRELGIRFRNRYGEDVGWRAVRQTSRELCWFDGRFDVGRHGEDRVVGRLLDPFSAGGSVDASEEVFGDDETGVMLSEGADEVVDGGTV
jgi:hypothetical protein